MKAMSTGARVLVVSTMVGCAVQSPSADDGPGIGLGDGVATEGTSAGPSVETEDTGSTGTHSDGSPVFDLGSGAEPIDPLCVVEGPLPPLLGDLGRLAAPFDEFYEAYSLGPVPGVPDPLGGTILSQADPNVLIVVGASEDADSALYEVPVVRDNCGHIVAFVGSTRMLDVPYADANLVHAPGGLLMSQYPIATVAQVRDDGVYTTDLTPLGIFGPQRNDVPYSESPGGLGLVPSWLPAAGDYRTVGFPTGQWYHLEHELSAGSVEFVEAEATVVLDNGPGAFDYVPPDSPGFLAPSIIVTEWFEGPYEGIPTGVGPTQRVAVYEVDSQGDPIVETRRPFFDSIERPWGAYFDPVSGDFLFLAWYQEPDLVTQVRGFTPPPAS